MAKENTDTNIIKLFLTFFKIGIMTFGGGYAMIPMMQKEFVNKKNWITNEEMSEMIAIAESTPGSLSVNAATFIGRRACGLAGAFFSTLGVILPSFIIILILSHFLNLFRDNIYLRYAFFGLRAGVLALVIKALIIMAKQAPHNAFSICLMIGAFITEAIFEVNTILVIIGCALISLAAMLISSRSKNTR